MVSQATGFNDAAKPATDAAARQREKRLERLIEYLPRKVQAAVRWLRRPSSRRVRMIGGVLLIAGALLSILPGFGLWMLTSEADRRGAPLTIETISAQPADRFLAGRRDGGAHPRDGLVEYAGEPLRGMAAEA